MNAATFTKPDGTPDAVHCLSCNGTLYCACRCVNCDARIEWAVRGGNPGASESMIQSRLSEVREGR